MEHPVSSRPEAPNHHESDTHASRPCIHVACGAPSCHDDFSSIALGDDVALSLRGPRIRAGSAQLLLACRCCVVQKVPMYPKTLDQARSRVFVLAVGHGY